jgi:carbamoyl-phosphate synthase large subunit
MKINIAVTSAGSAPAVAVIKALKKQNELDLSIAALDMNPASSGMYLTDKGFVIPPSGSAGFIEKIIALCKRLNIKCLIPIIDEELFVFADNKDDFEKSGISLIVNNKETVRLTKNKFLTHQFCVKEKILTPKTFLGKDIGKTADFNYPLIIKPLDGRGSRDVIKIIDDNELNFFKRYFKNYIIQQFIEGEEYTIDIVASPDGHILQAVPRQRISVKAGMSYKGKTVKDQKLIDYGKYIAKKFNVDGPANIQCILNKKGIYLIEVNPKFAAGLPLTVASGLNIPLILIKFALGLNVSKKELEFKDGVYMLRYWEEIFVPQKKIFG